MNTVHCGVHLGKQLVLKHVKTCSKNALKTMVVLSAFRSSSSKSIIRLYVVSLTHHLSCFLTSLTIFLICHSLCVRADDSQDRY